jgi:beta-N-acetylhexosaminidase
MVPTTAGSLGILLTLLLVLAFGCGGADSGAPAAPGAPFLERNAVPVADSLPPGEAALDSLLSEHDLDVWRPPPLDSAAAQQWVDSLMAALPMERKLGQLFIANLPASVLRRTLDDAALDAVEDVGVGGFLVPRTMAPREVFEETQRLQRASDVPLFFAADYERGAGRFNNAFTELPSNMALGATRDTLLAAAAGRLTAIESRAIGVNLLFAPVVDVNNNPDNPIINIRSYAEDPALVGTLAAAFVREAQRFGLLTTLKHFPGHGDTTVDSHARLGTVAGDWAALDSIELAPYRHVLQATDPAAVMTAHLWIPALEADPVPATLSPRIVGGLLRDTLDFRGVVITDDVKMGALKNTYSLGERVVRSLQAGVDVVLTPGNLTEAVQAAAAALERGDLTPARIDASVRRILWAKARAGLHRQRMADAGQLDTLMARARGARLAQAVANEAVTVLRTSAAVPVPQGAEVALVQMANVRSTESIDAAKEQLAEGLGTRVDLRVPQRVPERLAQRVQAAADTSDVVVVALYQRLRAGRGEAGLYPAQEALVHDLTRGDVPVVLVTFGNPYAVSAFPEADAVLVAYEQSLASVYAVVRLLDGSLSPRGKLPVTADPYPYGSGLENLSAR